jgi:SepF-like predicted cell division protein (DUF552 family)
MKKVVSWVKKQISEEEAEPEYIEMEEDKPKPKVLVRTFQLKSYDDVKRVLAALREGKTIALIDMGPLREKDVIDLKRSITKLKNVCAELGANIASLGGDWIIVAPGFAEIYKPQVPTPSDMPEPKPSEEDYHVEFY